MWCISLIIKRDHIYHSLLFNCTVIVFKENNNEDNHFPKFHVSWSFRLLYHFQNNWIHLILHRIYLLFVNMIVYHADSLFRQLQDTVFCILNGALGQPRLSHPIFHLINEYFKNRLKWGKLRQKRHELCFTIGFLISTYK